MFKKITFNTARCVVEGYILHEYSVTEGTECIVYAQNRLCIVYIPNNGIPKCTKILAEYCVIDM